MCSETLEMVFPHAFFVYRYIHFFYFLLIEFGYFILLQGNLPFFEINQIINMKLYKVFYICFFNFSFIVFDFFS